MGKRVFRRVQLLVVTAMLLTLLPSIPPAAESAASAASPLASATMPAPTPTATPDMGGTLTPTPPPNTTELPTPIPLTVTPTPDPHLPSLALGLRYSSRFISVGDSFVVTLTVKNEAADAGTNLSVRLPLPQGVSANAQARVSRPSVVQSPMPSATVTASPTPTPDLTWSVAQLAAGGSASFTATLHLDSAPTGGALLLNPSVNADGLTQPNAITSGVAVVDYSGGARSVSYNPSTPATLTSSDSRVTVSFPAGAYSSALTLQHAYQPPSGETAPAPGIHRALDSFYLTATDGQGQAVHQFAKPVTITVGYTPAQLAAFNMLEGQLQLEWFDDVSGRWQKINTNVDFDNHTVTAQVKHFTGFHLVDGSSPSSEFIPSLQGFQVDLYTGGLSYSYPIAVPSGPNGLKPNLGLSYNSTSTDGNGGQRQTSQAGWAGKGWSLDTGSVALNMSQQMTTTSGGGYSLVLDGASYDLIPECPTSGYTCHAGDNPLVNPTAWRWTTANEAFLKIQVSTNGTSNCATTGGRGGCVGSTALNRYKWQVWTKDGTLYEYAEDSWWGWYNCVRGNQDYMETYKWQLSKVVDLYGNTINYNYQHNSGYHDTGTGGSCPQVWGTIDKESYPTSITWGAGTSSRYRVQFTTAARSFDTWYDNTSELQILDEPHETVQLNAIVVQSSTDGSTWQQVRKYQLGYAANNSSTATCTDYSIVNADLTYSPSITTTKLTLTSIQRIGNGDTGLALPATTFTYNACNSRGSTQFPNNGWNRLNHVDNGQGGTMDVTYQNFGSLIVPGSHAFLNNQRVTQKVTKTGMSHDGATDAYTYTYSYQHPAYNWLGRLTSSPPNEEPNAAPIYYDTYDAGIVGSGVDTTTLLIHTQYSEFRGHSVVTETLPTGNYTRHYFYQGEAPCTITTDPNNVACPFSSLRDRDPIKGKEYKTESYTSAGVQLAKSDSSFQVCTNDLGESSGAKGTWRSFSAANQTVETSYDSAGANGKAKTTNLSYDVVNCPYDSTLAGGSVYGNLTQVEELDNSGATLRLTTHSYATPQTGKYIWDKPAADTIYADHNKTNVLARSFYFYDGYGFLQVGNYGALSLARKLYDAQLGGTNLLHGGDMAYTYDSYGNVASTSTYTGTASTKWNGTAQWSGSAWSFSGTSGTAQTNSTQYDSYYHALPMTITHPLNLSEYARYDWRMGTLTQVIDYNGSSSYATYDELGRMNAMAKPGDSTTNPTEKYFYYDYGNLAPGQPFKYSIWKYETSGTGTRPYRPLQQFYDGLGRPVQTKAESIDLAQNVVADKVYDGIGQVLKESRPRYVNESGISFGYYTAITSTLVESYTLTSYDALGRPSQVTAPDSTLTTMRYDMGTNGPRTTATNARSYPKEMNYDVFGRLTSVREMTATGTVSATTSYTYSPLDLLTGVQDAKGNSTSISYDTLGRKTQMIDPDMGTWQYQYDPTGSLTQQFDAKSQTIYFSYDLLGRLKQKNYSTADAITYYNYDEATSSNGKGQRTSMSRGSNNTSWQYDSRGRVSSAKYNFGNPTNYIYQYSYDAADRLYTLTYPNSEILTYTYEAGWRQTSVCSNLYNCYATAATYTALDQPSVITFGSTGTENYSYSATTARLSQMTVVEASTLFNRSYGYDNVGNVQSITNNLNSEAQTFTYDPLDRLTQWTINSTPTEQYVYDSIGNLTSKAGVSYTYGSTGLGTGSGVHQARNVGGSSYSYDLSGNLTSGGGRTLTWNAENQLTQVADSTGCGANCLKPGGGSGKEGVTTFGTETYTYDADGERATRTVGGSTTKYIGGLYELDSSGTTRSLYQFGGKVIAQRTNTSLYYLHGDHLGSVSLSTSSGGALLSNQDLKPWGAVRSGAVTETTMNYTGQRKDGTGLLYYHARYYDPVLARFVSADSIVPSAAMGVGRDNKTMMKELSVDYHEPSIESALAQENQITFSKGFYFQLSENDQQQSKSPFGPLDSQVLNRYSYVLGNPLKYVDPTGHDDCTTPGCGGVVYNDSDYPVMVYGSVYDPSGKLPLQPGQTRDGDYIRGWYVLKPHQSTVDLGIGDADLVQAMDDDHRIYSWTSDNMGDGTGGVVGYGTNNVYKLSNAESVHITNGYYGQTLNSLPKEPGLGGAGKYFLADHGWKSCGPDHCKTDPYWFSRWHWPWE